MNERIKLPEGSTEGKVEGARTIRPRQNVAMFYCTTYMYIIDKFCRK